MAYTQAFREAVESQLSAVVPIQTRAMFGGVGIYSEGRFFAVIAEDKLYFKVDGTNQTDFEELGMQPFYPFDSPRPMRYWELPPRVLGEPTELAVWIDKSLKVAESAQRKPSKKTLI